MKFEFDPMKSESNKQKHGIDFHGAQALWNDPDLIEIPVQTSDEPRYLVVGKIEGKHWSGVITYRGEKARRLSENGYFPQSLRQPKILILKILPCIPAVKISGFLDLGKNISISDSLLGSSL
jgi:uncharacterized protein